MTRLYNNIRKLQTLSIIGGTVKPVLTKP